MTVRTYGQLPYTVAVLGAAEVMRGQRILYVWLRRQAALERLSGVPQVCERRRRPTEVAKHCRPSDPLCQPEVGGRIFSETPRAHWRDGGITSTENGNAIGKCQAATEKLSR